MATGTIESIDRDTQPGCVVIHRDVSWEAYEQFLDENAERRTPHSYVNGELRFMPPSAASEQPKKWLAQLVDALTEELVMPRRSLGSLTIKLDFAASGCELDEGCLIASARSIQGKRLYDYTTDAPPDLVLEIDITSPSLQRLPVYAALGVREVWVYDGEQLRVLALKPDKSYEVRESSAVFPTLPMPEFTAWIEKAYEIDETPWIRSFREWVRDHE